MPVTKLTCPKCEAVLKPAKPIPEGKTIKCPKCGASITVGAEEAAISAKKPAVQGSAARTTKAPGKKAAEPAKPAEPVKTVAEEPEEPATYGLLQDPAAEKPKEAPKKKKRRDPDDEDYDEDDDFDDEDDEDEEEEEEKPDVGLQYILNEKTRDPRGPAQELIVGPSNWLMFVGILGAFGYFVCIVFALWPFIFPPDDDEKGPQSIEKKPQQVLEIGPGLGFVARGDQLYPTDSMSSGNLNNPMGGASEPPKDSGKLFDAEKDVGEPSKTTVLFFDLGDLGYAEVWMLALAITGFALGIVYNSIIVFGAVQTQNLTKRKWGITASILAAFPAISGLGCALILSMASLFLVRMFCEMIDMFETAGDVVSFVFFYSLVVTIGFLLLGSYTGIKTLIALNKPQVIEGFEFKSD